jgi:hypothetical protein
MRYIALILLLFITAGKTFGRGEVSIQTPVTIDIRHKSLYDALAVIAQQSGVVFSYNPQEVNTARIVSLRAANKPLSVVLKQLLGSEISFKQHGIYVILAPVEAINTLKTEELKTFYRHSLLETKDSTLFSKKIDPVTSGKDELVCHSSVNSKNDEQMKKQITALLLTLATAATVNEVTAQQAEQTK